MGQPNGNKKAILPIENSFCVILMYLKNLFGLHTCQSSIQDVIFCVNQSIMAYNGIQNVFLRTSKSVVNMCTKMTVPNNTLMPYDTCSRQEKEI